MNNKLSLTIFLAPLLLAIWISGSALDARAEWELIAGNEDMGYIYTLESDGHRLYLGTQTGVYMSLDNGYTWLLTGFTTRCYLIAITHDAVYAWGGYKDGLYRTDDRGLTWTKSDNGLQYQENEYVTRYSSVEQILVTSTGTLIAVGGHHRGTFVSDDRGETWHSKAHEWLYDAWPIGNHIRSMTEFDGYLWASESCTVGMYRTADNGATWEYLGGIGNLQLPTDWAVLDNRLYHSAYEGVARWNESASVWDDLNEGLELYRDREAYMPAYQEHLRSHYHVIDLAVNRGRLFTLLSGNRVWVFDERSDTWSSVARHVSGMGSLISHQADLYAVNYEGVYRMSIPIVHAFGRAVSTWGALKTR